MLLLVALCIAEFGYRCTACTSIAVGRKATSDGSVLVTQSNDGDGTDDSRLVPVPRRWFPKGSMRPIVKDNDDYPRYVGDRASVYAPSDGESATAEMGQIPQVETTFAYWEGGYAMMNEHSVSIGESSCTARLAAPEADPAKPGQAPMLPVEELSRIGLERCATARCAVKLMGRLAEEHGFVAETRGSCLTGDKPNECGESLMVGDASEVFIFHVLSDGVAGAVWVAQRVADDSAAVVSNMFVVREIPAKYLDGVGDDDGEAEFLFSESMLRVAEAKGWWRAGEKFDFTAIYSDGETIKRPPSLICLVLSVSQLSPLPPPLVWGLL